MFRLIFQMTKFLAVGPSWSKTKKNRFYEPALAHVLLSHLIFPWSIGYFKYVRVHIIYKLFCIHQMSLTLRTLISRYIKMKNTNKYNGVILMVLFLNFYILLLSRFFLCFRSCSAHFLNWIRIDCYFFNNFSGF